MYDKLYVYPTEPASHWLPYVDEEGERYYVLQHFTNCDLVYITYFNEEDPILKGTFYLDYFKQGDFWYYEIYNIFEYKEKYCICVKNPIKITCMYYEYDIIDDEILIYKNKDNW